MTASTTPTTRSQARKLYLAVVEDWAVSASEAAEAAGMDTKTANALLKQLRSRGLVEGTHVNGARTLTWQSYHDVQNESGAMAQAKKDFTAAWPTSDKGTTATGPKNPATGPRYTDAQLRKALKLRSQGKSRREVAAAIGVKSPNYLARMLTRLEQEQAKASKPAKGKATA